MTIKDSLQKAPVLRDAAYVTYIKNLVLREYDPAVLTECKKILLDENQNKDLRFNAFYCLFSFYRRFEKRSELYELVDDYGNSFSEKQYNYYREIVLSQYYKFQFLEHIDEKNYRDAVKHGEEAVKEYGRSSLSLGCYNNYAEIVLEGCKYKDEGFVKSTDLNNAMKFIDRAIASQEKAEKAKPYSRYCCSKARLLLSQEKFSDAKKMIRKAIAYESTEDKDSLIRISFYHNVELEILTGESLKSISSRVQEAEKKYSNIQQELDRQQFHFIEILAFFAAIIALITGTITIVLNAASFNDAFGVIISLAGCLLISFTVLKALFAVRKKRSGIVFGVIVAILMLVLGYCFGNHVIPI